MIDYVSDSMNSVSCESILIEHVSGNQVSSGDKRKGTGCWNLEMMHCFTAKKLPDAATENCKTIGKATVRSLTSTFKL